MTFRPSRPAFAASLPFKIGSQSRPISNRKPVVGMVLEVGQRVRVVKPLVMYHYPKKKNIPVDVQGFEGVIVGDISRYDDTIMTATAQYVVEFPDHPRFKAHFEESELEVI